MPEESAPRQPSASPASGAPRPEGGVERPSKITHTPGLGAPLGSARPDAPHRPTPFPAPPDEAATAAAATGVGPGTGGPQSPTSGGQASSPPTPKVIRTFGERKRHEDSWSRTPNTTGTGAIHVKTFHSKLTDEAMSYLDQQVNEWLDAHPQYEVKFVSTSVGEFTGKLKEPHLILQVWV